VAGIPSDGPSVRVLGAEDDEALWSLRRRALTESPHAFTTHPDEHPSWPAFRELQSERRADGDQRGLGAYLAGTLVGMAVVVREGRIKARHRAHLYSVYVAPEARRAGVGRALVEAAIEAARALGAEQLELAVGAHNAPAIELYQQLGFRRWGVQPRAVRMDGHDLDEIWMALVLDASSTEGPTPRS
jgi:ribosomal protein S18 acetylase RimI-like enzyme